ncbi:MAG: hypothetical protein UV09_C0007G0001, partial [Candidatus Gottesmanbacteria bacterium GW2011_GWA2_42_18]
MITQQVQVKLNLPLALKEYLESKAMKFDMPIAGYIKHLILKDVSDLDYPTFRISESSEVKVKKALNEKKKTNKISDVSAYFK